MKYTSIFSPDKKVTAAQYISELVCRNRSISLKIELPLKFWEAQEWMNYYKVQLMRCYPYLKKYDEDVMIQVIKEKNIWSLMAKWIDKEFQAEQKKRSLIPKPIEIIHDRVKDSIGHIKKKTNFGFLDD